MRVALPVVNFFSIWIRAPPGQSDGIRVLVAIKSAPPVFRPFLIRYFHEWFSPGIGESSVPLFLLLMSGVRVRFLLLMCGWRSSPFCRARTICTTFGKSSVLLPILVFTRGLACLSKSSIRFRLRIRLLLSVSLRYSLFLFSYPFSYSFSNEYGNGNSGLGPRTC